MKKTTLNTIIIAALLALTGIPPAIAQTPPATLTLMPVPYDDYASALAPGVSRISYFRGRLSRCDYRTQAPAPDGDAYRDHHNGHYFVIPDDICLHQEHYTFTLNTETLVLTITELPAQHDEALTAFEKRHGAAMISAEANMLNALSQMEAVNTFQRNPNINYLSNDHLYKYRQAVYRLQLPVFELHAREYLGYVLQQAIIRHIPPRDSRRIHSDTETSLNTLDATIETVRQWLVPLVKDDFDFTTSGNIQEASGGIELSVLNPTIDRRSIKDRIESIRRWVVYSPHVHLDIDAQLLINRTLAYAFPHVAAARGTPVPSGDELRRARDDRNTMPPEETQ